MSLSKRSLYLFKLYIASLGILGTGYYLFFGGNYYDYNHIYDVAVHGRKSVFVQKAIHAEIDGPFDYSTITHLCSTRKWTEGLIFKCESPEGGVGIVRNVFLNCVRYAIEAGATAFVVPEIMTNTADISHPRVSKTKLHPFTHFFDLEFFRTSLAQSCPQIHVYSHSNDLWDVPSTAKAVSLSPQNLSRSFVAGTILGEPHLWGPSFHAFLSKSAPPFSSSRPVLVSLKFPTFQFPLKYDDPRFVACFGRMLRLNEDFRRLAASALYSMSQIYNLDLNPWFPGIQPGLFYGAHIATVPDTSHIGSTPFQAQASSHFQAARHHSLRLIFLSSGNLTRQKEKFAEQARILSIAVTTTSDLLGRSGFEAEKAEFDALQQYQKDLVDYAVLLRASQYGGTTSSTFSWNVAMRRHVVWGGGAWLTEEKKNHPRYMGSAINGSMTNGTAKGGTAMNGTAVNWPAHTGKVMSGPAANGTSANTTVAEWPVSSGTVSNEPVDHGRLLNGPAKNKTSKAKPSENNKDGLQSFSDGFSVIFGPAGAGKVFELSMWP